MASVMKSYRYDAIDANGKRIKGTTEGTNKVMVTRYLESRNLSVMKVEEYSNIFTKLSNISFGQTINAEQLNFYLKQLGSLLTAGVKLVEALEILATQQTNKAIRKIYFIIQQEVYNGNKLSSSFELFPNDFPPLLIAMTEAGEATGDLGATIARAAEYFNSQGKLNKKIKKAVTGPLTYLIGALGVAIAMVIFVFPTFVNMFSEFGSNDMPIFTKIYLVFYDFLMAYGLILAAVIIVVVITFIILKKKSTGFSDAVDMFVLKVPGFGKLIQLNNQILIANTLSQLMGRGVGALPALKVVRKVVQNRIFIKIIDDAIANVEGGKGFAKSFEESSFIDPIMARMISTGEKTSEIPKLLNNLTIYYNEVADVKVAQVEKTIKPVLMLFVYAVVMSLLLAIMMPQLSLASGV